MRTEASGWLPPVSQYNIYDEMYGCAGDGSPITGIRCWTDSTNPDVGVLMVRYRWRRSAASGSPRCTTSTTTSGSGDDYAGNGARIDRFRACYGRADLSRGPAPGPEWGPPLRDRPSTRPTRWAAVPWP